MHECRSQILPFASTLQRQVAEKQRLLQRLIQPFVMRTAGPAWCSELGVLSGANSPKATQV